MKKTSGTSYIPSRHKVNYWAGENPGTDYHTLLKKAQLNHPKEYPKHKPHTESSLAAKKNKEKKAKIPKIILLPDPEDEDIF